MATKKFPVKLYDNRGYPHIEKPSKKSILNENLDLIFSKFFDVRESDFSLIKLDWLKQVSIEKFEKF